MLYSPQKRRPEVSTCPVCGLPKSKRAARCRSCAHRRTFDARYLAWRREVLSGENWTCQACGKQDPSGEGLQAHHIRNWHRRPDLRYAVENGITLCRSCHERFHRCYGNWGNHWGQVREFLSYQVHAPSLTSAPGAPGASLIPPGRPPSLSPEADDGETPTDLEGAAS